MSRSVLPRAMAPAAPVAWRGPALHLLALALATAAVLVGASGGTPVQALLVALLAGGSSYAVALATGTPGLGPGRRRDAGRHGGPARLGGRAHHAGLAGAADLGRGLGVLVGWRRAGTGAAARRQHRQRPRPRPATGLARGHRPVLAPVPVHQPVPALLSPPAGRHRPLRRHRALVRLVRRGHLRPHRPPVPVQRDRHRRRGLADRRALDPQLAAARAAPAQRGRGQPHPADRELRLRPGDGRAAPPGPGGTPAADLGRRVRRPVGPDVPAHGPDAGCHQRPAAGAGGLDPPLARGCGQGCDLQLRVHAAGAAGRPDPDAAALADRVGGPGPVRARRRHAALPARPDPDRELRRLRPVLPPPARQRRPAQRLCPRLRGRVRAGAGDRHGSARAGCLAALPVRRRRGCPGLCRRRPRPRPARGPGRRAAAAPDLASLRPGRVPGRHHRRCGRLVPGHGAGGGDRGQAPGLRHGPRPRTGLHRLSAVQQMGCAEPGAGRGRGTPPLQRVALGRDQLVARGPVVLDQPGPADRTPAAQHRPDPHAVQRPGPDRPGRAGDPGPALGPVDGAGDLLVPAHGARSRPGTTRTVPCAPVSPR